MSTQKTPTEIAIEWFDRVWNKGERSAITELADENLSLQLTRDIKINSSEEFVAFHTQMMSAFDYLRFEPVDIIESGEKVAGICKVSAKPKNRDTEVDYDMAFVCTVRDGKFISGHNVVDFLEMLKQLGQVDRDLLEQALA